MPVLLQTLWEHLPDRPEVLQASDEGGLRAVHSGDVRKCPVRAGGRKTSAKTELVKGLV